MRKFSICVLSWSWLTSDLFVAFNEAECMLARGALSKCWRWDDSFLLFVLGPGHLLWLLCSYKAEGFIWVPISHSCWEKQPGSGYFMYEKTYVIRMKFSFISGQDNLVITMAFAGDAGVIILFRLFLYWWAKNCEWLQASVVPNNKLTAFDVEDTETANKLPTDWSNFHGVTDVNSHLSELVFFLNWKLLSWCRLAMKTSLT